MSQAGPGRAGDPCSVGLLFDGGAAQEEAGIAGQRALLFLPWSFIFLRFRRCRFRPWEAKGGVRWRGPHRDLVDIGHVFQDLGRTEPGVPGAAAGGQKYRASAETAGCGEADLSP